MSWSAAGRTDVGKVRSSNEDAFAVHPDEGLFVVADGMGGHAAGEVASRIAVEEIARHVREEGGADAGGAAGLVSAALRRANEAIRASAEEDPRREGMGTTATVLLDPGAGGFVVGHVGDSRAYRLRNGTLERLTRDQTWVQRQVDAGVLEPAEARRHPYASVLVQALGLESPIEPEIVEGEVRPGDLYLLCSDGLTATLADDDLARALEEDPEGDPEELADRLVRLANERGGPDNITVVLARCPAG